MDLFTPVSWIMWSCNVLLSNSWLYFFTLLSSPSELPVLMLLIYGFIHLERVDILIHIGMVDSYINIGYEIVS